MRLRLSNVLVLGATTPTGINTIKPLKLSNFIGNVLSTDSNALSADFLLTDYRQVIPEIDSKDYLRYCSKEFVNMA